MMEPTAPTDTPDADRPAVDEATAPREAYTLQRESFLEGLRTAIKARDLDAVRVFSEAVEALDRMESRRLNLCDTCHAHRDACECLECEACGERTHWQESQAFPNDPACEHLETWCEPCMNVAFSTLAHPVSREPFPCYGCGDSDADGWANIDDSAAPVPACTTCAEACA